MARTLPKNKLGKYWPTSTPSVEKCLEQTCCYHLPLANSFALTECIEELMLCTNMAVLLALEKNGIVGLGYATRAKRK